MADFNKIGLAIIKNNKLLLCGKDNFTSLLIMPGGQIKKNENDIQCLKREIKEELDVEILDNLKYIDTYADKAAADNSSINKTVEIKLYLSNLKEKPKPSSEIIKLVWFRKEDDAEQLSPIIKNKIIPSLKEKGLLNW